MQKEYDFIIIGSGFGGSVAALRLVEKGYTVLVLEKGKRYFSEDFPRTNWNLRKYLWIPFLRCFGIQKQTFYRQASILSGVGVGGGSLMYANTLFMPRDHTFDTVHVGVYLNDQENVVDPYFNGHGPERKSCTECAGCMVGCRENAKNSLDKNYLYFAEKFGAIILPETYADRFRVHGYPGMYVFDGSAMQGNPGVNPSYSILAMAEYAVDQIPQKNDHHSITLEQLIKTPNPV